MATPRLLTPELLRELEKARFAPRTRVEGQHAGRHSSPARGSSTEFRDYRAYAPGDDPARVDWRVYARSDRHVLRTYEQESQTGCVILLDASASMNYGDAPTKHRFAARAAACLVHTVHQSQDQAGLLLSRDGEHRWHPPAGSARHINHLLHTLDETTPAGATDLPASLRHLNTLLNRRCTLLLISDFYCPPADLFSALNPFIHKGIDLHLLQVLAPAERDLPEGELIAFRDLETGLKLRADPRELRTRYRTVLEDHQRALRELAMRSGAAYKVIHTRQPVLRALEGLIT